PIGTIEALVRHDGKRVVRALFRGEAMGPLDALGDALAGVPLEAEALRAALAAVEARPGFFLHGVRDAGAFVEPVLATRAVALVGWREKYGTLAALRARRDAREAEGHTGFAGDEHRSRGALFRSVAEIYPGALRELESRSTAALSARARAADLALTGPA